ncbi:MAG: hypothetical protein IJ846_07330 [Alphaproteobacteria bacterium]|nr:hypothetical protein [Alphaproteobacteria bacterium]
MFRVLYSVLLPFVLPFVFYWIYRRRRGMKQEFYPVQTLTAAGLGLVLVFLFMFSIPDKAPADSAYVPPKFENGQIVPATLQTRN